MQCYRLCLAKYDPLNAGGAVLNGGRFNSPGRPMLYFASTTAGAILESRVHSPLLKHLKRVLHIIEIADEAVRTTEALHIYLPSDWKAVPASLAGREFGDAWLASGASLALQVPSVTSPGGVNILVNPLHPQFLAAVKVIGGNAYQFDRRLYRRSGKSPR